jgi:hypothetical protein
MQNGPFRSMIYVLNTLIFHSYVKFTGGYIYIQHTGIIMGISWIWWDLMGLFAAIFMHVVTENVWWHGGNPNFWQCKWGEWYNIGKKYVIIILGLDFTFLSQTIHEYPQMVVHQIGENPNSIGNFNGKMRCSIIKCGSSPIYTYYTFIYIYK